MFAFYWHELQLEYGWIVLVKYIMILCSKVAEDNNHITQCRLQLIKDKHFTTSDRVLNIYYNDLHTQRSSPTSSNIYVNFVQFSLKLQGNVKCSKCQSSS